MHIVALSYPTQAVWLSNETSSSLPRSPRCQYVELLHHRLAALRSFGYLPPVTSGSRCDAYLSTVSQRYGWHQLRFDGCPKRACSHRSVYHSRTIICAPTWCTIYDAIRVFLTMTIRAEWATIKLWPYSDRTRYPATIFQHPAIYSWDIRHHCAKWRNLWKPVNILFSARDSMFDSQNRFNLRQIVST